MSITVESRIDLAEPALGHHSQGGLPACAIRGCSCIHVAEATDPPARGVSNYATACPVFLVKSVVPPPTNHVSSQFHFHVKHTDVFRLSYGKQRWQTRSRFDHMLATPVVDWTSAFTPEDHAVFTDSNLSFNVKLNTLIERARTIQSFPTPYNPKP